MKKLLFILTILAIATSAQASGQPGTFSNANNETLPGQVGTLSSDNQTITWSIQNIPDTLGGYFFTDFRIGGGTAVTLNWYTSFFATGENDWTIFAPKDETTLKPTKYNLTMPAASMVWIEPIPFPDGTQRVKCMRTDASEADDIIVIRLIPGLK